MSIFLGGQVGKILFSGYQRILNIVLMLLLMYARIEFAN